MQKQHPYSAFVHTVQKPARYVGGEYNQCLKPSDEVDFRVCLAFPDLYDIGMSHMGTKILYKLLNDQKGIQAERAFAPWLDMEKALRERELPLLSLESATPLSDFDVVGFSLQYELTFTNVLNMLDLGGIPVRNRDRSESDPLVIAGQGVCEVLRWPVWLRKAPSFHLWQAANSGRLIHGVAESSGGPGLAASLT